ncbi:secretion/DNA translocation related TadE-like protein [Nocardia transvalensis]|uniref:Secretion/DNA translocation related TadE-like protein n=1 Tax=Nocardia transvalensis TaxID=37333 RepID=A0A7W9PD12_9NOCA|nr:Rv3654c family TadE-like protein [Nocardia transvalensis]MBB5913388.1 secretion/DNA translocation related TadE-like protein [Nocardia transvalensis]
MIRSWRSDVGSATVAACLVVTALVSVTALIAHVGTVVAARHRAQTVADLGALAAAGELRSGAEAGCARARELGERMRARVQSCTVAEWDVTVTVIATVSLGPLGSRSVRATARAGPADERVSASANLKTVRLVFELRDPSHNSPRVPGESTNYVAGNSGIANFQFVRRALYEPADPAANHRSNASVNMNTILFIHTGPRPP